MEWKMGHATWKNESFQDEWWRVATWSTLSQDKTQELLGEQNSLNTQAEFLFYI